MVSDQFHLYYEKQRIWEKNKWLGVPCWKLPFDAFVMQNLIYEIRPDFIIETGTGHGGSALFYASILELIGYGLVITVDIEPKFDRTKVPAKLKKRIISLYGSSTNSLVFEKIESIAKGGNNCMVFLDSWHGKDHVLKELELYSQFVSINSYIIVEDSHASKEGHPVKWEYDDEGAWGAIQEFLKTNDGFESDHSQEYNLMTFNPNGFLKRIK